MFKSMEDMALSQNIWKKSNGGNEGEVLLKALKKGKEATYMDLKAGYSPLHKVYGKTLKYINHYMYFKNK